MNQLIRRLLSELASATDPNVRMEVSGRLAIAYARLGQFQDSKATIQGARGTWGPGTLWVMLAEGVLLHIEHQSDAAMDRIGRAITLAIPLSYSRFIGLAAAWRAHLQFEASDFTSMLSSLDLARTHAEEADLDAQARMAADIASTYYMCGKRSEGQTWFRRGHSAATSLGDQAGVEALLYNKAALSFAAARFEGCFESLPDDRLRSLRMEVNSARNLNLLIRASALSNHLDLIDARLLALEGRHSEAFSRLQALMDARPFAANHFSKPYLELELAYTRLLQRDLEYARSYMTVHSSDDFSGLDDDDRMVGAFMRRRLYEALGEPDSATEHAQSQTALAQQYSARCADLAAAMDTLLTKPVAR